MLCAVGLQKIEIGKELLEKLKVLKGKKRNCVSKL